MLKNNHIKLGHRFKNTSGKECVSLDNKIYLYQGTYQENSTSDSSMLSDLGLPSNNDQNIYLCMERGKETKVQFPIITIPGSPSGINKC